MNYSPDSTLILVRFENVLDILLQCQISLDNIDIASLLVLVGCAGGKSVNGEFRDAFEGSRERVVEAASERFKGLLSYALQREIGRGESSLVDSDDRVVASE